MTDTKKATPIDGRRLRSERSKQAIIDAALELMTEGVLIPTAQQISDRAEVGIRSFFRHFDDMETLFVALDARTREETESQFLGGKREGSLDERIRNAVAHRGRSYEIVKHIVLSTSAQLWRYPFLRKNYAQYQRALRRDLDRWLPELAELPGPQREALDALTSFEAWNRLRQHQGLGVKAATEVLQETLATLVKGWGIK